MSFKVARRALGMLCYNVTRHSGVHLHGGGSGVKRMGNSCWEFRVPPFCSDSNLATHRLSADNASRPI